MGNLILYPALVEVFLRLVDEPLISPRINEELRR
jgi:hypothetical protein